AARLTRRGLTLSVGALAAALAQGATAAALPDSLVASTVRVGEALALGAAASVASESVAALTNAVTKNLSAAGWKPLSVALLTIPMFAAAASVLMPQGAKPTPAVVNPVPPPQARPVSSSQPSAPNDREKLQGRWVAVEGAVNGNPAMDPNVAPDV